MKIALVTDTHFGGRNDSKAFDNFFRKFYEEMFFPTAAGNEGEEGEGGGSDAAVSDPSPVGAMDSSSSGELLISTLVVVMIIMMSLVAFYLVRGRCE